MNRRHFLIGIASCAALSSTPWLASCAKPQPLDVCIHPWIGYESLYLARDFGWLPKEVKLCEDTGTAHTLAMLQARETDVACLTLYELLQARAKGVPASVVLIFDVSAGADVVLARPGIWRIADLAGKRIGIERNTLGELVFEGLLQAAGLPASAFVRIDLPRERQVAAWDHGEVDAVITYAPNSHLLLRKGAQRLFDSRQMPETIFDVLAVRNDLIPQQRAVLQGLVAAHFRGLRHLQTNREDAVYRIAMRQHISPDEVRDAFAGVVMPSLAANREYLSAKDERLLRAARTVSALMVRNGLLPREDALLGLLKPSLLPEEAGQA